MIYLVIGLVVANAVALFGLWRLFNSQRTKLGVLWGMVETLDSKEYIGVIDYNTVKDKITSWSEMRYKMLNDKIDNVASANSIVTNRLENDIDAVMFKLNTIQKELDEPKKD